MYIDFEDYRPETPRVPPVISVREGVLLSIIAHLVFVIAIILMPNDWLDREAVVPVQPVGEREPVRFVHMVPPVERQAPPRPNVEHSDLDRRATTPERGPRPENTMPFSRGDTPERVVGAPEDKAAGPDSAVPAPPSSNSAPPESTMTIPERQIAASRPASGQLGSSLRNLQRYLQDQNFDNQRGGLGDQDPDIQFDSKGVDFGPWLRRFVTQVKRNWFVPQAAMSLKGRVVIQFYVLRNGTITDLRVVQTSSIQAFDLSSFNALKMSNPTMPLPDDYPDDRAFFTVTFHYNDGLER